MTTLVAIPGSLRRDGFNQALALAAAEVAPGGCRVDVRSIRGFPVYDGDVEAADGVPEPVEELKERIVRADGLLLVTPEYNNGIPGPFKNAVDWLSRPPKDISRVFGGKPVGLMGATPGGGGTRFAQTAWLPVLRSLGTRPWFGSLLYVARAGEAFEGGRLVDAGLRERLTDYMEGFATFVRG